jgi:hypothetical protein
MVHHHRFSQHNSMICSEGEERGRDETGEGACDVSTKDVV